MPEQNAFRRRDRIEGDGRNDEGGLRAPPGLGPLGKAWWWFRFVILVKLARLRFIAVLCAIGGVIAYWDTLNAYYEKWTRPLFGQQTAIGSDSEYSCPMHPAIVRDHPDKCPICAMPLSKRKKGDKDEEEALPPGVSRRVQISPYKVAVAGIETAEIGYRPLTKEIAAVGFVEFDERKLARISARVTGKTRIDKLYVNVTGQHVEKGEPLAELYSPDLVVTVQNLLDARQNNNRSLEKMARDRLRLWGVEDDQIKDILKSGSSISRVTIHSPIHGHVIKKYQVEGEYVEEGARLYDVADLSTVWIEAQVYEDELAFLKLGLPVTATAKSFPNRQFKGEVAFMHPHLDATTRTLKVRFDMDNPKHELRPGMYATVHLQSPVARVAMLRDGRSRLWSEQTTVELTLTALYQPGAPATGGGFTALLLAATEEAIAARDLVLAVPESAVIDTGNRQFVYRETEPDLFDQLEVQLGPRSGAYYPVLHGLQAGDRVATTGSFLIDAETRLTAGVSSTYFGASGGPQSEHRSSTVARPSMKRGRPQRRQGPPLSVEVKTNLAKLSAEDRRLAEEQRYCPIELDSVLGKMGTPIRVEINGQKVFLCCEGCKDEALAHKDRTLAKVKELKARGK